MSSGEEGMNFNPEHKLTGFQPGSKLLKLVLDFGWIGLILTMVLYLMILS